MCVANVSEYEDDRERLSELYALELGGDGEDGVA